MFNIIGNDMIENGSGIFGYFGWFSDQRERTVTNQHI